MVEHVTRNDEIVGSIPIAGLKIEVTFHRKDAPRTEGAEDKKNAKENYILG